MNFATLRCRLIAQINWRVQNGELTERRLARLIGVSQPHMHNVLKGVRILSPEMGDRILRNLQISLLDLCWAEGAASACTPVAAPGARRLHTASRLRRTPHSPPRVRDLAVYFQHLAGCVGPTELPHAFVSPADQRGP